MAVTGAATLGGALEVTLINDFSPELGDTFTIMTYGSVSGSFASASLANAGSRPEVGVLAWVLRPCG